MSPSPDLTLAVVKTALALALVLGVIWALYRLSRGKLGAVRNPARNQWIRILENRYLGVKKSIALVKVPGEILVVGISADKVNLLSRITDPQIMTALDEVDQAKTQPGFLSIFQRAAQRQAAEDNPPKPPFMGGLKEE